MPARPPRRVSSSALAFAARLALASLLALAACASEPARPTLPALADADYPGTLRPPTAAGRDVLWTQHVTASWPDGSRGFDAALQIQGDELLLLGLTPLGTGAFTITLRGTELEFVNTSDMPLPFPARFIVLDVERVFFPYLDGLPLDAQGAREAEVDGERVHERFVEGRLVERTFERLDARPPGRIVVTYASDAAITLGPARAELDNGWFGYRLGIETLAETPLDP
ncbi:MAG: DUF3261 domain-containing protein [Planctomycetes bacterium]|nr:DUF3261 domain-containing protein [Planctomycetota bacterium]